MTSYLIALSFLLFTLNSTIENVVTEFHALKTESAEILFIEKYKQSSDPSVLAYTVSISMKQAAYSYNPFYKLEVFNANKKRLDALIVRHKTNIHLRYVRLVAQQNAPSFLGYTEFIEEDKRFLRRKLAEIDDTDFLDEYIKSNTSL
jgi:hypothetical protein